MKNSHKHVRRHGFEAHYRYESSNAIYNKDPMRNTLFTGNLYVDRFGRERDEHFIGHNSEQELIFVDIWDTLELKACTLDVKNKTVLCQGSLDMNRVRRELDIGIQGIVTCCIPRHVLCGGEDLGTKQVDGLVCRGSRRNTTGFRECPSGVIECWYSDVIAYLVFAKATFGNVESVFQLSNVRFIKPNKDLFVIPEDYTQATIIKGE
jgi:hypothetical protein